MGGAGGWSGRGGGSGFGSQVGCERRIEVFVKIKKNGVGSGRGGDGSDWGGGGVRVNGEVKFL